MSKIDVTARIEDGAVIADDVSIGPFCVVGANVTLAAGCRLVSHVNVAGHTSVGAGTTIHPFASIGTAPQSLGYKGEPTRLEIGRDCIIRESATMNTGTVAGGGVTRVGDRGFFMAYSHVGHDCIVGSDVIFANSATLGGHCEVGDHVFIGGLTAVHQFVRIGAQVMVAGMSGVRDDIIPYSFATGQHAKLEGLNVVGMRRRKFTRERLQTIRRFYQQLFVDEGTFAERLERLKQEKNDEPAISDILAFIEAGKNRSLCMPAAHNE